MQILQAFAIYDKKAQAYIYPHFTTTKGQAIRSFEDAVNDPSSAFFKHPEDFCLFHLGEYSDSTGQFKSMANPIPLEEAINLKATEKK